MLAFVLVSTSITFFPHSWGLPPDDATGNVPLPGGYGYGSQPLATWIKSRMQEDQAHNQVQFPPEWGHPPEAQTRDLRQLPFGYLGRGSGTLATWIADMAEAVSGETVDDYVKAHSLKFRTPKLEL